jgi:hypothetical protein
VRRDDPHPDLASAARWLAARAADWTDSAEGIEKDLYGWYLHFTPAPVRSGPVGPAELNLPGALDAAHADVDRFTGGWHAVEAGPGGVLAERGGLRRIITRSEYVVPVRPGLAAVAGDALMVREAWTWVDVEGGFWYTRRGDWPPPRVNRLTRVYLHVAPADAPAAIAGLTSALALAPGVPYQLKASLADVGSVRADGVVLYLGTEDAAALEPALQEVVLGLAGLLHPGRPRFTAALVDGVPGAGRAESSLDGESFGDLRCRMVADAWRTLDSPRRADEDAVLSALVREFIRLGVDPARPDLISAGPG